MKKIIAAVLALGMTMSLAACGSSSTASSSPESSASTSSAESSVSTSSAVSSSATASGDFVLAEEGKLHMATNAAFPPYESTTDDGGFEGIDVEIAQAIADKLGLELVIDNMDFSSVVTAVSGGKDDIAMAGLTVTEERKKNLNFTDTYTTTKQVIIVPEDSEITSVDDLGNAKAIGCQEGTTGYLYCSDTEENGGYGDKAIGYQDGATAIQALLSGKVDAVVIDENPAKVYVEQNEGLKILDTAYAEEEYAIGIAKGNDALLNAVNDALNELKDDGTVQEIIDKYITTE